MNFVWRQVKEIQRGGLPLVWRKVGLLPQWLGASRCGQTLAIYGYKLAIAVNPNGVGARFRLAKALGRLNRANEAAAGLKAVISIKPDFAEAHAQLAETLLRLGRFDEAFAAWERAFQFKPDWPEFHKRIEVAFHLCGQTWAARSIMQKVIDTRNDFARAHQLDKLGIRFSSEFSIAIGHIALLDIYVKMGMLGWRSPARSILLVKPGLPNPCYLDYWRRYLPDMIADPAAIEILSPLAKYLEDHISAVMDSSGQQSVGQDYIGGAQLASIQAQWEAEGRGPLLTLTDSDHERGWQCLRTLGVPADAWFVGLHVREEGDESRQARDTDIATYRMAIESIVARGGWVVRMGDPAVTPLPLMPQVIDYARSNARSDWMDVFLWARCRFFIGTQSGPAWVPPTFGVPCVVTNSTFLSRRWFGQDLFITKLLWSEGEQRYLSFAEAVTSSAGVPESLDYFTSGGLRIVDNTPEEINDVAMEMLDRLEGNLKYTEEDEQLQGWFDRMWTSHAYKATGRIGRDFLRKWAHLLD
ncbi:MAG: TIGR04372 family glycosyltransferase [Dehalococcoidales bacterium]|nr:TIGR04372 family glycosyltransferase [Dehalococcoidales bacterium]